MNEIYHCGVQPMLPHIKSPLRGIEDFMWPNTDHNPYLPEEPGENGMLFRIDDGSREWAGKTRTENRKAVQRVLVRLRSKVFRYLGQYEMSFMGVLAKEDWAKQPDLVGSPISSRALV